MEEAAWKVAKDFMLPLSVDWRSLHNDVAEFLEYIPADHAIFFHY